MEFFSKVKLLSLTGSSIDGIPKKIASAYYFGLKLGGKPATDPKNKKKVHRAP